MCVNYLILFVHLCFSILLSVVIFFLSYIFILKTSESEKLSAYECGFSPFESQNTNFEVRYFLVALLFILFDLEVSFLFPWATLGIYNDALSFFTVINFIYILTIGYIYEWRKGALDFC